MTTFHTISQAKKLEKGGDLIVKVIAVSDISKGAGDKGPWERQTCTLKDNSGKIELTLWNEDVGKLDQGQHVKLEGLFWKPYKDELTPNWGKYTKVALASADDLLEHNDAFTEPTEATPDRGGARKQPELESLEESIQKLVHADVILIAQIEKEVSKTLNDIQIGEVRGDKIGMVTRMIFYHIKGMVGQD